MVYVHYNPIGTIHSPFKRAKGTPIQPPAGEGVEATAEILPEYVEGLQDLEGFSHIILVYHFHLSRPSGLRVKPFMDTEWHGIFATRAPSRPNSIGLSTVRLTGIRGNVLHICDVDIVDGTPLLDVKPYVPEFEPRQAVRRGWLEGKVQKLPTLRDNGRFGV